MAWCLYIRTAEGREDFLKSYGELQSAVTPAGGSAEPAACRSGLTGEALLPGPMDGQPSRRKG